MMITKKKISRRTVLRGLGVTVALPLLDGMVPALTARGEDRGQTDQSFCRGGRAQRHDVKDWLPAAEGAAFEFMPTMAPLAPFRNQLLVLSNLNCVPMAGRPGGTHAESVDTLPDRRVAADERVAARRRHFDGPDPRAGDRQAYAVGIARAGNRVQ